MIHRDVASAISDLCETLGSHLVHLDRLSPRQTDWNVCSFVNMPRTLRDMSHLGYDICESIALLDGME